MFTYPLVGWLTANGPLSVCRPSGTDLGPAISSVPTPARCLRRYFHCCGWDSGTHHQYDLCPPFRFGTDADILLVAPTAERNTGTAETGIQDSLVVLHTTLLSLDLHFPGSYRKVSVQPAFGMFPV